MGSLPLPSLNVIIIGAGLGGLGAAIALRKDGHTVTVLESSPGLNEFGAGVQVPPSSTRILNSYGVLPELLNRGMKPESIKFLRYDDGELIGRTDLDPELTKRYGSPYFVIHRADFQEVLYNTASSLGVTILFSHRVETVNEARPSVLLANGREMEADVIIGADGTRTITRRAILSKPVEVVRTNGCTYRALVPASAISSDPEIAHLLRDPNANCWIGPYRHLMTYPIRNRELYNLVMFHPGALPEGKTNRPLDLEEMKEQFKMFDPVIQKVLTYVQGGVKWQLGNLPSLPTWISPSGHVVLIGDAAHSMVPFLAQGAATAIEDGAILATCLARADSPEKIPRLLKVYEAVRRRRVEIIQRGARSNGHVWHMPDGPLQIQRDAAIQQTNPHDESGRRNPNLWCDFRFQPWLFGSDPRDEADNILDMLQRDIMVLSSDQFELKLKAALGSSDDPLNDHVWAEGNGLLPVLDKHI